MGFSLYRKHLVTKSIIEGWFQASSMFDIIKGLVDTQQGGVSRDFDEISLTAVPGSPPAGAGWWCRRLRAAPRGWRAPCRDPSPCGRGSAASG